MFPIYSVSEARQSILKRKAIDDYTIPQSVSDRLEDLFNEKVTPDEAVRRILKEIRADGDKALVKWSQKLDGSSSGNLLVPQDEISSALSNLQPELKDAIQLSIERVRKFHQMQPLTSWISSELGGILGQVVRPIQRVGLYIPAGTAPLPSSVIMSAVPAQVAGVAEIVIVAPPERSTGKIALTILATAALLNLTEIYTIGGAQAIAALAYGTETIKGVDKIFGPGNLFVTLAKKQVFGSVGIDNLAGPTETLVIADSSANPAWVAADLLAQAEHDLLATAILLTPSQPLAEEVVKEIEKQLPQRSRSETIIQSIANQGGAVITTDLKQAIELANAYGAEHLCLAVQNPWDWVEKITCAGGIFLGDHSFEVLGDYIAGPSHVMPTSGSARFASPLNVWDFIKLISVIGLDSKTANRIAPSARLIASAEGLDAHAFAATVRF